MTKAARPTRARAAPALQAPEPRLTKGERTRAVIKGAISDLIGERQSLDFTLDDICAKTGLTVGAFYFHFANKDAALEEMCMDHIREFYATLEAVEADSIEELSRAIISSFVEACVKNPAMFRATYTLIPRSMPIYETWIVARGAVVSRMVALLAIRRRRPAKATASEHLDVHLLMAGLEGFLENLYFGTDATMKPIPQRPQKLQEELWAHWRSVLLRPVPVERNVKQ